MRLSHRVVIRLVFVLVPAALVAQDTALGPRIDRIFARFDANTPGCAVGLSKDGTLRFSRGYGSANLEYRIPLTDSSVMESGSVAKQFTAAALVLLANDGKLSLDDDIRKYLPEVPDFGKKITIRNLLTHTSGLRDQWGLLAIEGRGPGTQVHSPATTLELVRHQKTLNFPPGSAYLYSNTGYALAGIIVARVSGKSLQQFSQERLFIPLGMTHTLLRDDFTRIVPNRATAYSLDSGVYHMDMPFTNMVGNGGVLSTIADLHKWNENFVQQTVGGPRFTETMQTRMTLTNGRVISYALGLEHFDFEGVHEVTHSGATAGYRTVMARYPDQHVAVMVWCSNGSANATQLGRQVASLVLTKPPRTPSVAAATVRVPAAELARWAGIYRDVMTDQSVNLVADDSVLRIANTVLVPAGGGRFRAPMGEVAFARQGNARKFTLVRPNGDTARYESVAAAAPAMTVSDYTGVYRSEELETRLEVQARGQKLFVTGPFGDDIELKPAYADGFSAGQLGTLRFARGRNGKVSGFAIYAGRVLNVSFAREHSGTR